MSIRSVAKTWRLLGVIAMLAMVLSIGAIACSDDDDDEDGEPTAVETMVDETPEATDEAEPGVAGRMDITAREFAYENVPATQPGGLTTITMNNIGAEDHQAIFGRLNEGATLDQLQTALESDETGLAALELLTLAGGANVVVGGETTEVIHDLSEGSHVMLCFVASADGVPHVAKGMIQPFEVVAPEGEEPQPPAPDAAVTVSDFKFEGLTNLAAGAQTVQVINNGPQPHEVTLVKLDEGFTAEQLLAMFTEEQPTPAPDETPEDQGPPPFTSAGGFGAIAGSGSGYMVLNLEAGNYAMLCFVPDPATGAPHAALGMVAPLTVE